MSSLTRIAGKKFTGDSKNKVISRAETNDKAYNGALITNITSDRLNVPVTYKGTLLDFDVIKGIKSETPNLRFKLNEICTRTNNIALSFLEEIAKQNNLGVGEGMKYDFKEETQHASERITWEGYMTRTNEKLGVKIERVTFIEPDLNTAFNVAELEKTTRDAFTNYLSNNSASRSKKITEYIIKEKEYRSKSAVIAEYDGELEESPITQTYTGITRTPTNKKSHIREAHKKFYKRKGVLRAIAPTIIHIEQYDVDTLREEGFKKTGEPSLEALLENRGTLTDQELRRLNDENKFQTMNDIYGVSRLGTNYKELKRIFG